MNDIKFKKIDLHMHSTVSDGTDTPAEIISRVKKEGIDLFSITDHDATKGCRAAISLLDAEKASRPHFIVGAEFSCRDDKGKYHILGYGYDLKSEPIQRLVDEAHAIRLRKFNARVEFLASEFRFGFSDEDMEKLLSMDNPGKPHLANLMVKYGFAKSKEDAMENYINKTSFKSEYLNPEKVIGSIVQSGGIPVLAHPVYGDGADLILGEELQERIEHMIDLGVEGLEAFYSGFSDKMQQLCLDLAERFDLYVTAGSDYHGTNKLVRIGDNNLKNPADGPAGLERFLNKVKIF